MTNWFSKNELPVLELSTMVIKSDQKTVAKKLKISPQYLHDILNGRRRITDKIAKKIGYERITYWKRIKATPEDER